MSNTKFINLVKLWVLKKWGFFYQDVIATLENFLVTWNLLKVMINTDNLQEALQAPLKWDGRLVSCNELSELHDYKWELAKLMDALILHHINVPPLRIGCVYTISTIGSMLHDNVLWFHSGMLPCLYLFWFYFYVTSSFIWKKGNHIPCKHFCFIFAKRIFSDAN